MLNSVEAALICGRGKTQVVLDFANPAVRDDLFRQLDTVYSGIPSRREAAPYVTDEPRKRTFFPFNGLFSTSLRLSMP